MAKCTFTIPFPKSSEKYLKEAEKAITGHKGQFSGDATSGKFAIPIGIGHIEGEYRIANEQIVIDVTKKPLIVTCHMIETRLKGYLEPPAA